MRKMNLNNGVVGAIAGATATLAVALLMGQGAGQPVPNNTYRPGDPINSTEATNRMGREYFVTGDATRAQLWVRDGSSLRWVSSSEANKGSSSNGWTSDGTKPYTNDSDTTNHPTTGTPSTPSNPNPSNPNPR